MKKIEAIIRTSRFYEVKDALHEVGVDFFSYTDVKGVGNQKREAVYRGTVYDMGAIARTKLEIIISENLEKVVSAILEAGKTGDLGDGKIFVYDCESVTKIRTGETGVDALRS
ncbi:MAG: P-II family nitrogen regulator [Cyclobacteriaceae bacterium]